MLEVNKLFFIYNIGLPLFQLSCLSYGINNIIWWRSQDSNTSATLIAMPLHSMYLQVRSLNHLEFVYSRGIYIPVKNPERSWEFMEMPKEITERMQIAAEIFPIIRGFARNIGLNAMISETGKFYATGKPSISFGGDFNTEDFEDVLKLLGVVDGMIDLRLKCFEIPRYNSK